MLPGIAKSEKNDNVKIYLKNSKVISINAKAHNITSPLQDIPKVHNLW